MKKFIKDNLCLVVILGIVVVVLLSLGIWGITKLVSSDDKKLDNNQTNTSETNQNNNTKPEEGKYDSINDAKDLVDSDTIEKLYNYILGMSYSNQSFISELYQDKKLTFDDLTEETIIRTAIFQLATCENSNQEIAYTTIEQKVEEIFGQKITIDSDINIKLTNVEYECSDGKCVSNSNAYCSNEELESDYQLISVIKDINNSNILYFYEENESGMMYRHALKKDDNKYHWYYIEPLGK